MKKFSKYIVFIFILLFQYSFAQQEKYAANTHLYKEAENYYNQQNFQKTFEIATQLIETYPLDYEVYVLQSNAYFYLGKKIESLKSIENAIALEPTMYYHYLIAIRNGLYTENLQAVTNGIEMLSLTCNTQASYDYSVNFLTSFKNAFKDYNTGVYGQCLNKMASFETLFTTNKSKREELLNYDSKIVSFENFKTDADFKNGLDFLKELQLKNTNGQLNSLFYNFYIQNSNVYFKNSKYKNEVEKMNNLILSKNDIHPLQAFAIYKTLITTSVNPAYKKEISKIIESKAKDYNNTLRASILVKILEAEYNLGNKKQAQDIGESLKKFIPVLKNDYVKIDLYCWIATTHQHNNDQEGLRIINEGMQFIKQNGYSNSTSEANLKTIKNLLLLSSGNTNTNLTVSEEDHASYFNLALQHLAKQEYDKMSEPLEKGKKIIENQYKNLSTDEKKNYLNFYSKTCANLLGSYIFQKNNPKTIETIESYKGFYLSSLVKNNTAISNLAAIQKTLQPDEALIYLMNGATSDGGMYMAVVVDKNTVNSKMIFPSDLLSILPVKYKDQYIQLEKENAKKDYRTPIYNENPKIITDKFTTNLNGEIRRIIEMYREHLHPNTKEHPSFLNEPKVFGNIFYRGFFQPLEDFLVGKKKIILSLDQDLNLIPFESLVTNEGKFLIEKYDVAYIQNGSMLVNLRNQPKVTYPKNIIAFGDAKYEKMASNGKKFSSIGELIGLNFEVADRIEKNLPLNEAFATFSKEAMNYLEGSKREVENIQQIVPKSDVRMDKLMTENEFKRMAKSGELNQYRVIHLSSHASVHRYIFDLSGIAFSVPANPVDDEDGILVVKELEKLKFKTDFVMLSACQTGLGQIIPGEGVVGLNSALFTAGAKNTLTSLWSVSDYATTVFTTNLYKKIFTENKSYKNAVNEVKRSFIKGEYNVTGFDMSHPNYWAAFTYYGE